MELEGSRIPHDPETDAAVLVQARWVAVFSVIREAIEAANGTLEGVGDTEVPGAATRHSLTTTERYAHNMDRLEGKPERAVNDLVFETNSIN